MNRDLDARAEMQKAVDLDASFDNRYDLAVVCLDQDDEKCAAGNFQALEQSFGDTPAIHMQFGLAYGNSDFASKAEDEFRKVIARNPRYPEAHYCLAATYLAENDNAKIKAAESELEAELEVSPNDFLTYAALGKVALAEKQYDRAATYLHRAIALNAKNPDAYLYLGQLEFEKGDLSAAEQTLWKSIQLTIDLSRNRYQVQKAHYLLGRILMREGCDYVEFVHSVPEYPQVSRKLLQIHAAVAEILHMIDAADAVENILRDLDNIQVLSEDGADAQLLSHRLQLIAA